MASTDKPVRLFDDPELVAVVNGQRVTRADLRQWHREKQDRILANRRRPGPVEIPAYLWVFDNGPVIPYGGSHVYVRSRVDDWWISRGYPSGLNEHLVDALRSIYPCGVEVGASYFQEWKIAFMQQHAKPSNLWVEGNGLALITAVVLVDSRQLINVRKRSHATL